MTHSRVIVAVVVLAGSLMMARALAQQPQPAGQPAAAAQGPATVPGTVNCPAPAPPATPPDRMFTGTAGAILNQVPTAKVADFELFIKQLREAMAKSTDATVRGQAKGMRVYRDTRPGPNGDVVYMFLFDPVVPCVDYSFGPMIAAAFPDPAERDKVWKLNSQSVKQGTLMNFVPAGQATETAAATQKPAASQPAPAAPVPLDARPTRPPQEK